MPRVEANLDSATKNAFHSLAKRSGTTEAALLRRVIAALVKANPGGPATPDAEDVRSMRLTVRVTPDIFEAVTEAARDAGATRPGIVLGTLRARFLEAPTLLPVEAEAVSRAAYQLSMAGINLNQLVRSLHLGRSDTLPTIGQVVVETAAAVNTLREQLRSLTETATVRWAPEEGWQ
ncbi:hypothetical protein ABU614_10765 [Lysobacter firmicutimachus]|uniref:Plasmid mobilization relaxosome protein MobC n=1 Tax=Lysobacter firmicutimachus TaxID=1792846 RepID=A0AAU8N190_9GAMM